MVEDDLNGMDYDDGFWTNVFKWVKKVLRKGRNNKKKKRVNYIYIL